MNDAILDQEYLTYDPTETSAIQDDLIEYSLDTTAPCPQLCVGIKNTKGLSVII